MSISGLGNVDKNMREMTGFGIPIIFRIAWYVVTPILLAVSTEEDSTKVC